MPPIFLNSILSFGVSVDDFVCLPDIVFPYSWTTWVAFWLWKICSAKHDYARHMLVRTRFSLSYAFRILKVSLITEHNHYAWLMFESTFFPDWCFVRNGGSLSPECLSNAIGIDAQFRHFVFWLGQMIFVFMYHSHFENQCWENEYLHHLFRAYYMICLSSWASIDDTLCLPDMLFPYLWKTSFGLFCPRTWLRTTHGRSNSCFIWIMLSVFWKSL